MENNELNNENNLENTEPETSAVSAEDTEGKNEEKINWGKEVRDWVISIGVAVLVALLIHNFVFTLVNVKGASMDPSLHDGDRMYVNRFFYKPQKGDVVIFRPATDPKRPYVKRVIATEGDRIYIDFTTGKVYLNDKLLDEPYIKEKTRNTDSYIEKLRKKGEYSKEHPIVIQPGYIFVMGDNRNNSRDSRYLGPVPVSELIGGAVFRFWPFKDFGSVHSDPKIVGLLTDELTGLF